MLIPCDILVVCIANDFCIRHTQTFSNHFIHFILEIGINGRLSNYTTIGRSHLFCGFFQSFIIRQSIWKFDNVRERYTNILSIRKINFILNNSKLIYFVVNSNANPVTIFEIICHRFKFFHT